MTTIHVAESNPEYNRKIDIAPVAVRPPDMGTAHVSLLANDASPEERILNSRRALEQFEASLPPRSSDLGDLRAVFASIAMGNSQRVGTGNGGAIAFDGSQARMELAKAADPANLYAKEWRDHARWYQTLAPEGRVRTGISSQDLAKSNPLAKAVLDVGTQTNFASITGGESLGYVSLDTRVARGTVRPDSFTLYQSLPKSAAFQVVDYWPYIDDTGGPLPGSATSSFTSVSTGTLGTSAGSYTLQNINLKLMLDGRAVTMALMAQNNFVSVNDQENANAALTVLGTADWDAFNGNPALFPNQFSGMSASTPTANIFDWLQFYTANSVLQSWSAPETLFNQIYEASAVITSWGHFGRITHAFMTPVTAASMQGLVTATLYNIVSMPNSLNRVGGGGIVVDGDLQGMRTRMGPIQFPLDLMITARDTPAQSQVRANGTTPIITSAPAAPTTVVVATAAASGTVVSNWSTGIGSPFLASGSWGANAQYCYGVAACDVNMNETAVTFPVSGVAVSGITSGRVYTVTITPADATAQAFRVFRTGNGGFAGASGSVTAVRYVGTVLAAGASVVTFVDTNAKIPGGESIYLFDMREEDNAIDWRYLLPLTRIELFAQNLFMPWAVASIAAIRNRIPRFHGIIVNYIPVNPVWNPYIPNA